MGLMYIFPVSEEETDRVEIKNADDAEKKTIVLKTYGLPWVFWSYLAGCLIIVSLMWLASRATILKLTSYDDPTLVGLGYLARGTLIAIPLLLTSCFFYEKEMHKNKNILKLVYKLFFIPVWSKKIVLDSSDAFTVEHFMDSPNMAKIYNREELKGFENKGYFELKAVSNGKKISIDRHSRKVDLTKMKDLMGRY